MDGWKGMEGGKAARGEGEVSEQEGFAKEREEEEERDGAGVEGVREGTERGQGREGVINDERVEGQVGRRHRAREDEEGWEKDGSVKRLRTSLTSWTESAQLLKKSERWGKHAITLLSVWLSTHTHPFVDH